MFVYRDMFIFGYTRSIWLAVAYRTEELNCNASLDKLGLYSSVGYTTDPRINYYIL